MKFLKKIKKHPDFWPIVVILFFAILAGRSLIFERGYFNMHDDLQMMRQLEMEKCFLDGQIPCRWVPDMGYGFGFPLFNFYPPLPYLMGEVFRVLGASFVNTAKLTFALSFMVSGIGMYFLAKDFFGRLGGILASIFIFWTSYRLIKEKKNLRKWMIGLALSWLALFTSHNLMVLIFTPLFGAWLLLHLWQEKSWRRIPQLAFSGIVALGLAAFFTLPALLENQLTHIESVLVGYYDYTAHFVSIGQLLFSRFWGYGPSVWGVVDDRMSFQVGHIHWLLVLLIGGLIIVNLIRKKNIVKEIKKDKTILVIALMFLAGWFAAFMAHPRSTPIWLLFSQLRLVQFPWRFLTLIIFSFSFIIGALPKLAEKFRIKGKIVVVLLAALLLLLNWNYFRPEHGRMGKLTDEEKFSGAAWELQQTAGIYDYLPIGAKEAPKGPRKVLAEVMGGEGQISKGESGTYWAKFNVDIESENSLVRIDIFKFPNWKVTVDGQEVDTFIPEDEKWGRMYIDVPEGEHEVYAQLYNTWPRTLGNIISLISLGGLLVFIKCKRKD
ncbi:MAG: hypothetical protein P8Y06_02235 [Patescibacteria group bacterium]